MAILRPFKAWRPNPKHANEIACLPYDVVHTDEAREILKANPNSFMKVVRPEADFDSNISTYAEAVYIKGRDNLNEFLSSDFFTQESEASLYIYRLKWHDKVKTGIFGCVSVDEYDSGSILKHELTRPEKENDRTRHIITQNAHAESVMITFQSTDLIRETIQEVTISEPLYQFMVEDEVEHFIWKVENPSIILTEFEKIEKLYIADGHHRCASASRASKEIDSNKHPEVNYFPAVLFPMDEVQILAYNRIVFSVPETFLEDLNSVINLAETSEPEPKNPGEVCIYSNSKWYKFELPESKFDDIESQLDVARLQEHILDPLLGITDQRTNKNVSFVGGVHGIEELERYVDSGQAELAISMYPTSINELVSVSDAGQLMPPKSTWFEPKLRSGLLIHTF